MDGRQPRRDGEVDIDELFERYAETGDRALRNELILRHRWVAIHCVRRFAKRGVPTDDLVQVAQVGVLKAVERFDPQYGVHFATFAIPTVLGELRRHFRDATWSATVARRHKDRCLSIGAATEALAQSLGRQPSVSEIAADLGLSTDDVHEALMAGAAYRATSIDRPSTEGDSHDVSLAEVKDLLGIDEGSAAATSLAVRGAMRGLPERERCVLFLRFFEDLTQQEIADVIGVSQVHVSRLLRSSLEHLRSIFEDGFDDQVVDGTLT